MLGFKLPSTPVSVGDNAEVEYWPFESNGALDDGDAAIIPQGIFEVIETTRGAGEIYTDVRVRKGMLQER